MKVICIDAKPKDLSVKYLKEGVVYDVKQSYKYNHTYQILPAICDKRGIEIHFGKRRFIPLSDIDETKLGRNYNPEYIKQLIK